MWCIAVYPVVQKSSFVRTHLKAVPQFSVIVSAFRISKWQVALNEYKLKNGPGMVTFA